MRKTIATTGALLGALALAACGHAAAASKPKPIMASGTITVATVCADSQTYPDVQEGSQVTVKNAAGTVIGSADLSTGSAVQGIECSYPFSVTVPGGFARYGIQIGNRGTVWYSPAQMKSGPALSLG